VDGRVPARVAWPIAPTLETDVGPLSAGRVPCKHHVLPVGIAWFSSDTSMVFDRGCAVLRQMALSRGLRRRVTPGQRSCGQLPQAAHGDPRTSLASAQGLGTR